MKRQLQAAILLITVSLSGCGGPVRLHSKAPEEISQAPQRIMVIHSVRTADHFSKRLAENLTACGVASTFLDGYAKQPDTLRNQANVRASDFNADFALEVTATTSQSDQSGLRAIYYRFTLTELAKMRQVWEGGLSLYIRRIQRSGTEADLADELVWSLAGAKILRSCPPRPKEKTQE